MVSGLNVARMAELPQAVALKCPLKIIYFIYLLINYLFSHYIYVYISLFICLFIHLFSS
jgi:hypothetical protein